MAAAEARGDDVARLHSGDISIWSAAAEQMGRPDALGIAYDVTPGVPAFAAAAAALHRELTAVIIVGRALGDAAFCDSHLYSTGRERDRANGTV